MKQQQRSVIYILRCWQEDTAVPDQSQTWRFRLETPTTAAAQSFRSTEALVTHLLNLFDSKETIKHEHGDNNEKI